MRRGDLLTDPEVKKKVRTSEVNPWVTVDGSIRLGLRVNKFQEVVSQVKFTDITLNKYNSKLL